MQTPTELPKFDLSKRIGRIGFPRCKRFERRPNVGRKWSTF